jgi:hypothetical protein
MVGYDEIVPQVQQICNKAVESLSRFHALTDFNPLFHMPESFMASYIFDHLGNNPLSLMPEVVFTTLWQFNEDAPGKSRPEPVPMECDVAGKIVDLCLFRGGPPKSEEDPLCLIEFKRNWNIFGDIGKLRSILRYLDQFRFGAACGIVEVGRYAGEDGSEWLDWERTKAENDGDCLIRSETSVRLPKWKWPAVAFCRIFPNDPVPTKTLTVPSAHENFR